MADHVTNADELSQILGDSSNHSDPAEERAARERVVGKLRLLWNRRQFILRFAGVGLVLSTLIAFVIPKRFESTSRLMPPDELNSGMALLAAATSGRSGSGLGGGLGPVAGGLLGMTQSGALFVGVL